MGKFEIKVRDFGEKTEKILNDVARMAVTTVFQNIVMRTPHDTGRARANWQITSDEPQNVSLNEKDPTGSKTCQKIQDKMAHFDSTTKKITLYNNLAYIVPLEYGHSSQRPNGMVRVSLAEFQNIVNVITGQNK